MNTKAVTIGEIEPQSVLLEGNLAYSETFEEAPWDNYGIEITPLAESLTGILTGEKKNFAEQKAVSFETDDEEDYGIEITPLAHKLTGVLKTHQDNESYDWRAAFYEGIIKKDDL